jgi:hypothetical protein
MPVTAHKQAQIRSLMYQTGQHNRKQTSNQYLCWYQLKASINNLKQKQVRGNLTSLVPVYQGAPISTRQSTEHSSHTRHRTITGSLASMQTNNRYASKTISQVSTDETQQFIRSSTGSRIGQPTTIHRVL